MHAYRYHNYWLTGAARLAVGSRNTSGYFMTPWTHQGVVQYHDSLSAKIAFPMKPFRGHLYITVPCLSHQLTSPRLTPPPPLTHIHHNPTPHITTGTHKTQDSQAGWPHNTKAKPFRQLLAQRQKRIPTSTCALYMLHSAGPTSTPGPM